MKAWRTWRSGGAARPAAYYRLASRFVLAALVPLALALGGDLAIIGYHVTGQLGPAIALGAGALALFAAAWLGLPLVARALDRHAARRPEHARA